VSIQGRQLAVAARLLCVESARRVDLITYCML
jgi:hypothetical protein